jgi:hypothetical protein
MQIVTGAGLAIGWTAVRMFVPKEGKGTSDGSKKKIYPKEDMASSKNFNDKDTNMIEISPEEKEVRLHHCNHVRNLPLSTRRVAYQQVRAFFYSHVLLIFHVYPISTYNANSPAQRPAGFPKSCTNSTQSWQKGNTRSV